MDYKKYNDYELIYKVRENDEDSNKILLNKYLPIIRKISSEYYQKYAYFGYEYDDFYQEALLAFYQALANYNEEKNVLFYTFFNVCIRKKLSSFCRNISNKKNSSTLINSISIEDDIYQDKKTDIDNIFFEQDFQMIVHDVIINLPFLSGVIFELRYNSFSFREISILLDLPLATVEYCGRKAKKEIYYRIKKYYDNL